MASVDVSYLSSLFQEQAPQQFADATDRTSGLLDLFQRTPISDPRGPRWWVKTAGTTASRIADGGTYPSATRTTQSQASLTWGEYIVTIELTKRAQDELNAGRLTVMAELMAQYEDGVREIVDQINTDLLGGTNANGITGIQQMVLDDNTYAGIDRTSVTNFAAYSNDNTGTPRSLTLALMDDVHDNLVDANLGSYNAILTSQTIMDVYTGLSSGNGAPASPAQYTTPLDNAQTFIAGYSRAFYKGRPVIALPGYATDRMDFVDLAASDGFGIEELRPITVDELPPANGTARWAITCVLQAKLVNPKKRAAVLDDLQ